MRNQKTCFAISALVIALAAPAIVAQQPASDSKAPSAEQPVQKHFYKLTFHLRESDDGKVLNQRDFVLNINAAPVHAGGVPPEWWNVRSGTRVPVATTNKEGNYKDFNYIDVGVNLDVRAEEATDGLQMQVTADISSVAGESGLGSNAPAVRQVKVRTAVLVPVGKPTVVFTADDAASRHRFELEVTAVPQK